MTRAQTLSLAVVGLLALMLAACGTSATLSTNSTTTTTAPTTTTAAPTTTTQPSVAHVGESWTVTDESGDNVTVGLIKVMDPAQGANEFATPNSGDRFVAVEIVVTNNASGAFTDDMDNDVTVVGSDNQTYTADFDPIAGCTNFNSGAVALAKSASSTGCVAFQLPIGIQAVQMDFLPEGDFAGAPVVWDL